jgi:hypothetical protein
MAFSYSPKIITDGLTVYYDAANPNSYPGTGNTIFDLSRNGNHGTLINSPTFDNTNGGSIIFDGTNDYIQFTSTYAGTICFWGIADVGAADGLRALVAASATGDGSLRVEGGSFRAVAPNAPNADDYHVGYVNQFMINGISNLTTNVSGYYVVPDGRTLTQNFFVGAIGNRNVSTISHTFNGRVFKGKMFRVMIYNRQLSNDELLQNFNAGKFKFGIV